MQIALDDGEVLRFVDGLHDEPRERLLVLGEDRRGLEELDVEFGDGLLVRLCAEL